MVLQGLNRRPLRRRRLLAALPLLPLLPLASGCSVLARPEPADPTEPAAPPPGPFGNLALPPPLPREFRAAWVATVAHIDWPSRPGLDSAAQRAEMRQLLDRAAAIGLNALVLQVRPAADAIYPSALEPWSEYLTGASGRPPDEDWDPLAEWVAGAHRRGLELHAWFNPYRARHPSARGELAASHVAHADPAIVKSYGDFLWMDPGDERAAARMRAVVMDVVQRYDIDGVHVDDYFYPYPVNDANGVEQPFPDDVSWQRYADGGGPLARDDWRRHNVDRLIEALYRDLHAAKPWLRFGVSPFGLPRPDRRPPGIQGFSQYDKLYADVERWWQQGWMDYLAPQLYWPIDSPGQAFDVLLQAWREGNGQGRHLWPGLFTSRIGAERNAYPPAEVLAQVQRSRRPGAADDGHLHFSMAALLADREGVATQLRAGPYAEPALTPATPWLAEPPPQPPQARWQPLPQGGARLWPQAAGGGPPLRHAVLWWLQDGRWQWQARPLPAAAGHTWEPPAAAGPALEDPTAPAGAFELPAGWQRSWQAAWLVGIGRTGLESAPQALPGLSAPPHSPELWGGPQLSLAGHGGSA